MDVSTADGLLPPDVADFDPALAGCGGDEVTPATPDGADFDPTSLDSVWVDGDDATAMAPTSVLDAAPPVTGAGVVADPAPGVAVPVIAAGPTTDMDVGSAGGLLPGVVDFDPASGAHKRKRRSKQNRVAQDARKRRPVPETKLKTM